MDFEFRRVELVSSLYLNTFFLMIISTIGVSESDLLALPTRW